MEYVCIIVISAVILLVVSIVLGTSLKRLNLVIQDEKINQIANRYPDNIEICRDILKKLNNEKVTIEEDKKVKNSLYIAITDKIVIANTNDNFTRIQTIAHECLHSIQNRKLLLFNYIYSNIYLLFFYVLIIVAFLKLLTFKMLVLSIFLIMSFIYYVIRTYLENDAMIKAKYVAKEYMEEKNICDKNEIDCVIKGFDEVNNIGIIGTNLNLFKDILLRVIILAVVFAIF